MYNGPAASQDLSETRTLMIIFVPQTMHGELSQALGMHSVSPSSSVGASTDPQLWCRIFIFRLRAAKVEKHMKMNPIFGLSSLKQSGSLHVRNRKLQQ